MITEKTAEEIVDCYKEIHLTTRMLTRIEKDIENKDRKIILAAEILPVVKDQLATAEINLLRANEKAWIEMDLKKGGD